MMIPQDEATLQAITGQKELSESIQKEYKARIRMYHRGGASGSLGVLGCVDLLRHLGIQLPETKDSETDVDWRKYPQNGTVRVEVGPYYGQMIKGVFMGFAPMGMIAVRMTEGDNEGYVKEVRKSMVRLLPQEIPLDNSRTDDLKKQVEEQERIYQAIEKQRVIREEAERVRAEKRAAEQAERALAWSKNQESVAVAEPKTKPKTKKPKKPVEPIKIEGLDDIPAVEEAVSEPEYNEYIPPEKEYSPGRASLERVKELPQDALVYVAIGEGEDIEHVEGRYVSITEDCKVVVQVADQETPITVAPETISILD